MEELGIGRPSTYAMIIDTIQTRGYVELVDKTFKPTESGILTSDRLTQFLMILLMSNILHKWKKN